MRIFYLLLLLFTINFMVGCKKENSDSTSQNKKSDVSKVESNQKSYEESEAQKKERQRRIEKELNEKEERAKYINNSLSTGATPYSKCYGVNKKCKTRGCSKIKVRTPISRDVLVTIKKGDEVFRHAYIKAGSSYIFELPNGNYQPFFYYGNGWNPNKLIKSSKCKDLPGGFIENEHVGKDDVQKLSNQILEYELILQSHGNFQERSSDLNEAL